MYGSCGSVVAGGNLSLERLQIGFLEMLERLGTGLADAVVLGLFLSMLAVPLGSMRGSSSSSPSISASSSSETSTSTRCPEPGSLPAPPAPSWPCARLAERVAHFSLALPYSPRAVLAEAEMRHIELGNGNADSISPTSADHFAVRNVFAQILANPTANDLLEAALVTFDVHCHEVISPGRREFDCCPAGIV